MASVSAVAVEVRSPGSNRLNSPNISPGPKTAISDSRPSGSSVAELHLSVQNQVQVLARLTLVEQFLALGNFSSRSASSASLRAVGIQGREQGSVRQDVVHDRAFRC